MKTEGKKIFLRLIHLVTEFANPFKRYIKIDRISLVNAHDILSILHECYKNPEHMDPAPFSSTTPSASDLDRAGINFRPNAGAIWLLEMGVTTNPCLLFSSYWSDVTLTMLVFIVSEFSELILRNLIAYEQANFVLNHITSYAFALNKLVDTEDDVVKLVHSRVLVNNIGSNEEAASMTNIIRKELLCGQFFYGQHWKTLNKHYSSSWRKKKLG
ncbi:hypothetical protein HanOQP8_Chr13g0469891 [Helianthus annuus]|nr:hypothetical protein HanHA89_Chr13g0500441 [Helianthus annuus]KAJ0662550.1 hypothetical protein HanLR1_Chr13g0470851 [Helianthus annuus]KAJ0670070.1 hypothetical protein HanOQP8_Chr13g0469891 [Helianthus annuus]